MIKSIFKLSIVFTLVLNIIVSSSYINIYAYNEKNDVSNERLYSNNDYRDRYIEYNSVSIDKKIDKAMLYKDEAYVRIKGKNLPYQYMVVDEKNQKLIPELNSKIIRIFDDENGILAEVDDFYAAYNKKYSDEVFYKYDINSKEIEEIIPDIAGYNEFLEVMKTNGYTLSSEPIGYNNLSPIWIGFECYRSGEGNSTGFYNRDTKQFIVYKNYGFDKIELIKSIGDKAFFTYKNNHADLDSSNDESYVVMIQNGEFIKLGNLDISTKIKDISYDGKCIIDEDNRLYAITSTNKTYSYKGSKASISGDDAWVASSYPYNTIDYYNKENNTLEPMYKDEAMTNIVSNGKNNVFGFYMDFTGERGKYFRSKHEEVERAIINNVSINPDKVYMGYPYKVSVDTTDDALVKFMIVKDGVPTTYPYGKDREKITTAANRNSVTVYVKNKDSKYNYDDKYVVDQFIGYHTYYPIYTFDKELGKIVGYSGKPVKMICKGNDGTLIQKYIAIPDELGNFEINIAYPFKGGERLEISYVDSSMSTSEYISLPSDYKMNTNVITTSDTSINGKLKDWNGSGTVVAEIKGNEIGRSIPNPYHYNILLSEKLEKGTSIDVIAYDRLNKEIDRETLVVYEDSMPEIHVEKDEISILENEVQEFDFKSLVRATDRENGDISSEIKIIENNVINKPGDYKVVYSVSDYKGQIVEKEIKVNVRSNTVPVIMGIKDVILKVGDKFDLLEGVTASDKEDGDLTSKINISGEVDTNKEGVYYLEYSISDSDGNHDVKQRKVTVRSNEKPVINSSNVTIRVEDKFDPMNNVTAVDKEDGDLTSKILVIENTVDMSNPGVYKVVYEVEDSDNNIVTKEIKVTVNPKLSVMNTIPIINANNITIRIGESFDPLNGIKAIDKEDGDITSRIVVIKNEVDVTTCGIYEVVYKVSDNQGASSTKTIKVTVRSNEKPIIYANDVTLKVGEEFNPLNGVKAIDKEDGDITSHIKVIENSVDISKLGTYKVVYEVEDLDSNKVLHEIKVTVIQSIDFKDIDNHWAKEYIESFVSKGYINGYSDGTFRPDNKMTRAEFIKIINRAFGLTEKAEENFDDVSQKDWFYDEVRIGIKAGYISTGSKIFRPNDPISREEACKIIGSVANIVGDGEMNFKDNDKISDWAKLYVDGLNELKIVSGNNGYFRPKDNITRAESVKILSLVISI